MLENLPLLTRCVIIMIRSFKSKETKKLFEREPSKRIPPQIQDLALRKLWTIHFAKQLHDLKRPPSNHLEALTGDRKGHHSIRINRQWRICFLWDNGNAYEVEIIDYH